MKQAVFFLIASWLLPAFADELGDSSNLAIDQVAPASTYQNIVIKPQWHLSPEDPNYIVVKPDADRIVIKGKNYEWKEEEASFSQFRHHYAFYWSLFMTMMILDAAWVE